MLKGTWLPDGEHGDVPAKGWWIYRQFDTNGTLVYEGKTNSPKRRFVQHHESGKATAEGWARWELYECTTETEMDELEKVAILYNNPETNIERWQLDRYMADV
jgi:hypothetical protein